MRILKTLSMLAAATMSGWMIVPDSLIAQTETPPEINRPEIGKTPPGIPEERGAKLPAYKSDAPPMSLPPGGPANSTDVMFEPDVPNWPSGPQRESVEQDLAKTIMTWQEQVAGYSTWADEHGEVPQKSAARQLERNWQAVEQAWQKLRQSQNEIQWDRMRDQFNQQVAELNRVWRETQQKGKVGPRAHN